ncbi:MAG: DUF1631 family protein [Undibacterium sp.]|nr:DUF1631 family protein [Undibacterium sp.]
MDLNDLLSTTRVEFLRAFFDATQKTIPKCIEDLFKKADVSYSSSEQGRLLNARSVLQDQGVSLTHQMSKNMESLLTRSFQTTYNTFRPSTALSFSAESLSLVDASVFEDELRIDDITKRFRSEAEEQLRDLSIRIALIFEQDVTTERENPFRPYMFSRCIATSVENFGLTQDLTTTLMEQFAENFTSFVPTIYDSVNTHLAKHGIAAQLQFKIKKSPTPLSQDDHAEPFDPESEETDQPFRNSQMRGVEGAGQSYRHSQVLGAENVNRDMDVIRQNLSSRPMPAEAPRNQVEQLFDSVRGMASGLAARRSVAPQSAQGSSTNSSAQTGKQFGWLESGQAVGGVLRKFFGGGNSLNGAATESSGNTVSGKHAFDVLGGSGESRVAEYSGETNGSTGTSRGDDVSGVAGTNARRFSQSGGENSTVNSSDDTGLGARTSHTGGLQIASSVHSMQKAFTPATADMLDTHGAVRNLILEQRAALNEMTQNIDEQMTIDIVAMLFEFILRDNQVPAEVRAQLGRLQFMVLKVALRDTSLLTQKGHPARMLVNRIGSISLGLKQLDPSGAHITAEICRIVETLLQDDSENPQLFSKMLDEFDAFIARELRASDKNIERAVEVVEQVQNHTLRFAHTSAQMSEALLGLTIDKYLQEFLENTWVHAVEMADRNNEKRARGYRLLVPDLLWSIVPKLKEDDRTQLFALLPIILNTLREGLASIDFDSKQQQDLLNWLVDAHTSALRASHSATLATVPSLSAIHQHFDLFVNNPEVNSRSEFSHETPITESQKFLEQAIKELDIKVQMLDQVFDLELPAENLDAVSLIKPNDLSPESIQERLRSGVALEINLGGMPSQGWLNWVDPAHTNLVLSLTGQDEPSIVSVRMFRRMIAHGRVRFLETEPLFERAVQSLLKSADIIDKAAVT